MRRRTPYLLAQTSCSNTASDMDFVLAYPLSQGPATWYTATVIARAFIGCPETRKKKLQAISRTATQARAP